MIEGLRRRLALRDARAAVARRQARPMPPALARRTVLVALPADDAALRQAWGLVGRLALPDAQVHLVQTASEIGYAPDRWAGAVRHVGPDARDWRRLPRAHDRRAVWALEPDVGVDLAGSDLAAALLVGASPAALRVGAWAPDREPFYDLMVRPSPGDSVVGAVERVLGRLDPPIVPLA